jgi:hypothetical protein
MTVQQSGSWSRRAFLRNLTLAGAAGMFGVYPRSVAPVESPQTRRQPDQSSAPGVCPQRNAGAQDTCPNCCNPRYQAT